MYPNQPITQPFGEIYDITSPYSDKLVNQLQSDARQRKLQEQKDATQLDNEFAKNMAGIRDADVPDLSRVYGDWKMANQQLLKKKGNATPQEQLEVLRKKADIYQTIAKSKAFRDQEKAYGTDIIKNGKMYTRDAHGQLIQVMKTPVSKIGDTDVFEPMKYKGNTTLFQPILQKATGKARDMDAEVVDNPKELRQDVTKVKRLNNANEFYNSVLGGVVGSKAEDDFNRTYGNITPEAYQLTKQHYEKMMADPVTAKRFGSPEPLPSDEGLTDTELTAKYIAMQHALNNTPSATPGTPILMFDEREKLKLKNSLIKLNASDGYIRGRMKLAQGYKKAFAEWKMAKDAGQQEGVLNKFIDNAVESGFKSPYLTHEGQVFRDGTIIQVPVEIANKYKTETVQGGYTVEDYPKGFYISKDKQTFIPLYQATDDKGKAIEGSGGKMQLDPKRSKPLPIQNFKADLSKLLLTKSKTGAEVVDDFSGDDNPREMEVIKQTAVEKTPQKFNVINPRTGAVVMEGVDEETAKKAEAKGYKFQ